MPVLRYISQAITSDREPAKLTTKDQEKVIRIIDDVLKKYIIQSSDYDSYENTFVTYVEEKDEKEIEKRSFVLLINSLLNKEDIKYKGKNIYLTVLRILREREEVFIDDIKSGFPVKKRQELEQLLYSLDFGDGNNLSSIVFSADGKKKYITIAFNENGKTSAKKKSGRKKSPAKTPQKKKQSPKSTQRKTEEVQYKVYIKLNRDASSLADRRKLWKESKADKVWNELGDSLREVFGDRVRLVIPEIFPDDRATIYVEKGRLKVETITKKVYDAYSKLDTSNILG